jgi:hypothetical protein
MGWQKDKKRTRLKKGVHWPWPPLDVFICQDAFVAGSVIDTLSFWPQHTQLSTWAHKHTRTYTHTHTHTHTHAYTGLILQCGAVACTACWIVPAYEITQPAYRKVWAPILARHTPRATKVCLGGRSPWRVFCGVHDLASVKRTRIIHSQLSGMDRWISVTSLHMINCQSSDMDCWMPVTSTRSTDKYIWALSAFKHRMQTTYCQSVENFGLENSMQTPECGFGQPVFQESSSHTFWLMA